jgi:hypothetical protein
MFYQDFSYMGVLHEQQRMEVKLKPDMIKSSQVFINRVYKKQRCLAWFMALGEIEAV